MRPCALFERKQELYQKVVKSLESQGGNVVSIDRRELINYLDTRVILFVDEDECRAAEIVLTDFQDRNFFRCRFLTYSGFFRDDIGTYLRKLDVNGVSVFTLGFSATDYFKLLEKKIRDRFTVLGMSLSFSLPRELEPGFFDDLYTEEYAEQIRTIPFQVKAKTGELRDCHSQYYNVANGERYTVGQPEVYDRTVYCVGNCPIHTHFTEDKNTIESFLQMHFQKMGQRIRVVNYGSLAYANNLSLEKARMLDMPLRKGDVIVLCASAKSFEGVSNIDLTNILETHQVSPDWFVDEVGHCNHKVNSLYADAIYDALQPVLEKPVDGQRELIEQESDFVKPVYLDRYFSDFDASAHDRIGSIVMNCNPFTYGHRYLIEEALKRVDFLILFVVEEDASIFSFTERYAMVREGTADLENVKVVPSGPFILSKKSFPEYFIKEADEYLVENTENDITFFAERIAPPLNITCRFVGEEPADPVTDEYNRAMKRILPEHGIELVELPRKEQEGRIISASLARKCLEEKDLEGFKTLVPESTGRVLQLL